MYTYKIMSSDNIDELLDLQNIVVNDLDDKDYFRPSTKEMLNLFIKNGHSIGAYKDDNLIAYRLIYSPKDKEHNLGFDLDLNKNDLGRVIHFETAVVHPKYRGSRLQILLTKELSEQVNLEDSIVCASCYTMNYPSLSNLIKMGLSINTLKNKYDSKLRFILSNKKYKITSDETISYKCDETKKIKDILAKGYFGLKLIPNKDSKVFNILFQKGSWL